MNQVLDDVPHVGCALRTW